MAVMRTFSETIPVPPPAECCTDIGAEQRGRRGPLPDSAERITRVLIGGCVSLLAVIGIVSLLARLF